MKCYISFAKASSRPGRGSWERFFGCRTTAPFGGSVSLACLIMLMHGHHGSVDSRQGKGKEMTMVQKREVIGRAEAPSARGEHAERYE